MELLRMQVECLADVHFHLRDGEQVAPLIQYAIAGGADVIGAMPNTKVALTTASLVTEYIGQAKKLRLPPDCMSFIPFIMITESTTEKDIDECIAAGIIDGKIYPFMRTNKSENGIKQYQKIMHIVRYCGKVGMKCHFHPEHSWMAFDNRDAEFAFLPIVKMLDDTETTIIWEHGTDARCIPFWIEMAQSGRFYVTLTAHHLATDEDKSFGDVRAVCKPPIKTARDRRELIRLVFEDYPWVMAGTDSAYHPEGAKHVDVDGCACGALTAPFAHPLYIHSLYPWKKHRSDGEFQVTYVNFTSRNARRLHKLPPSSRSISLENSPFEIPLTYPVGDETGLPFWAGRKLDWKIAE